MSNRDLPTSWIKPEPESFLLRLRRYALTGILVMAPTAITVFILFKTVTWLDYVLAAIIPPIYRPEQILGFYVPGTGLIAGAVLVIVAGAFARNVLGRYLLAAGEGILERTPGVRSLYSAIKQIIETVAVPSNESFREVVLVEYPRPGIWAIAFVTGKTKGQVQTVMDGEMVNVFVPTTPNPTSGFLLFFSRKDVIKLDMTVEQGLKMVISAGIITPTRAEGKAAIKAAKTESKNESLSDDSITYDI